MISLLKNKLIKWLFKDKGDHLELIKKCEELEKAVETYKKEIEIGRFYTGVWMDKALNNQFLETEDKKIADAVRLLRGKS